MTNPNASTPAVAAHTLPASSVPAATSTRETGSDRSSTSERCAPGPGICDRNPMATAANSAYEAMTDLSSR